MTSMIYARICIVIGRGTHIAAIRRILTAKPTLNRRDLS